MTKKELIAALGMLEGDPDVTLRMNGWGNKIALLVYLEPEEDNIVLLEQKLGK